MILSLNWLKKYTDISLDPEALAVRIGERIVEVESVEDIGPKYQGIVVARVVSSKPIEGTDHLNLVYIDDGGVIKGVERDGDGFVQVVCGAPNVRAGINVAWLPPGSTVPATFSDAEPFVLSAKKLQGYVSNGMLASAKELDLYDDHTGIIEIDTATARPGDDFRELYELDDYLLDIENKSLTHRPDMFGVIGFAREVAAVDGKTFVSPEWYVDVDAVISSSDKKPALDVSIDDPTISERYQAVVLEGVDNDRDTPLIIKTYLARVGVRPISATVDITNYIMLVSGQPLHAFDYDKVIALAGDDPVIHVRRATIGEKLELLDGRTVELSTEDIVIAAGAKAIGLAGAMGGANSEIDASTKRIILESATFDLYALRGTQMRHGIFSEAITRFTKGQPAQLTRPALSQAIELFNEWTGAHVASRVLEARGEQRTSRAIVVHPERISQTLGVDASASEVQSVLERVEFSVGNAGDAFSITAPYWRTDIGIVEDIVEEYGRILGFDSIQPRLPMRDFSAVAPTGFDIFRQKVADSLCRAGANEALTYSFVHGELLVKVGQATTNSYKLVNSISPDLQYYRQTLVPNLLGLVHPNIKQGYDNFVLYEMNKVHPKSLGLNDEQVPVEHDSLGLVLARRKPNKGAAFYELKATLGYLFDILAVQINYEPLSDELAEYAAYEPKRSALLTTPDGLTIGVIGELKRSVAAELKLPEWLASAEIDTRALHGEYEKSSLHYVPLSRYPSTERDLCFRVASSVSYQQLFDALKTAWDQEADTRVTIEPLDIYVGDDTSAKNITFRMRLVSDTRTLTGEEVGDMIARVTKSVVAITDASVV